VFNLRHLLKAFKLYDSQFNAWSWNKRDLFWRQVVGYVQRFLPANVAMDFAQGLYNRVENKEKSERSFKFNYGDGSIFPPTFGSFSGLGFEYAAGTHFVRRRRCTAEGAFADVGVLKTYVEQKQQSWANYTARGCQQSLSNSVM